MIDQIELLSELFPNMVKWRRYLHQHPELSFQEAHTSEFIAGRLQELGITVKRGLAGHAVIGIIAGELAGPKVALRADMDALPIQDGKTCDYASQRPGVMHACGHDAHTSTLLALGQFFSERRAQLPGTIMLIFQHAEELSPGGALAIMESGALDDADVIYGVHLWTPFPAGHVYGSSGAIMAAADEFKITISGRGGHGGLPHETVDSIYIAAQTVVALQSVVSRNIDPMEPCVVSIGVIQGGTGFNVIADRCEITGTVRTFNETVRQRIEERMRQIITTTAAMYGGQANFQYMKGYPAVVNDPAEAARFKRTGERCFGGGHTHSLQPIMAGEDFSYYLQRLPGCFMLVGAGNAERGIMHPHHHAKFDIDETAMLQAAKLLAAMALDYMNEHA